MKSLADGMIVFVVLVTALIWMFVGHVLFGGT